MSCFSLLIFTNSCDVSLSLIAFCSLFLPIGRFGTKNKTAIIFLKIYLTVISSHLSLSFCCRWIMDELQVEYLKPARNISVGIYGWRKRCLYCLLIILTLVVLINLCLTFWLSVALGLHWVRRDRERERSFDLTDVFFPSGKCRTHFDLEESCHLPGTRRAERWFDRQQDSQWRTGESMVNKWD